MSDERTFDQTDPLIGLLVDERYRVTRRLARGGMATVYVAQDERLDRPVALKVMHPHLADSDAFVERFRREARSAARIVHPGVVSVFDQGVVTGQGFLVMELIDGTNLRQLLRAQGAFTIPQALRYTTDTLEALRAAHRVGVIHRDIKPENILVPSDGPAKVTDFGLARAASEVSMSSTGNMLGTVAYIAPEIATTAEADARSDIYSVGIMLYEMLT
ncbi:MAG: protein kinase, partial [Pauljensenia sp.]|nr:protein kinase [Pauljensenia sp.]